MQLKTFARGIITLKNNFSYFIKVRGLSPTMF